MKNLKLLAIIGGSFAFLLCCKKETTTLKEPVQMFYRLSMIKTNGDTSYSQIITTKGFLTEEKSTTNTDNGGGQCNNAAGHNNCKCDEKSPDFCAKHPCHWKCRYLGSTILSYFVVNTNNSIPTIMWETTDETGVISMILSRSTDSKEFKSIYKAKANQKPSKYSYIDK